jgi:hypothetical protein
MNVLNKGRCSRCVASKTENKKHEAIPGKITGTGIFRKWFYCGISKNWCKYIAKNCKQPPMGIPANEYEKLLNDR